MKKRDYYETPKSTAVMRFLWKAAGGDKYLLERATYSDQIKYMCLGGIVFATGLMAGLAGGYAFYTIFAPKGEDAINAVNTIYDNPNHVPTDITTLIIAILFGCIWGLMIFNIDRFIVTSTGKGDGTEEITWTEFKGAIPRIIMGAIIAITISKPIEIRMFQSEINASLQQYQDSVARVRSVEADSNYANIVKPYLQKMQPLQDEIKRKEDWKHYLDSMVNYENTHGGCRDKCEENKKERTRIEGEINTIISSSDYRTNDSMIKAQKDILLNKKNQIKAEKSSLNGLLIRIKLAEEIAGPWISLFITLLFMAIELTPIFFKLMLTKTPYDYLTENRDDLIKAENGIEVRYDYYKDKIGVERHLVINHEADRLIFEKAKLTKIQAELTEYALQKYKEREQNKIDANLEEYITLNKNNDSIDDNTNVNESNNGLKT
jgi:hypothetical protein